jgi:hypothetical protein
MTDDRTLERAARSWLEEGPTRAPDRPVEAALAHIQTTRQERDLGIPWRLPTMFTNRLALAGLAAVLVVALGGFALSRLPGGGAGGPGLMPSPSPSPSPSPPTVASPSPGAAVITTADVGRSLTAGTYLVEDFAAPFTVTLPAGWIVSDFSPNSIVLERASDGAMNVYLAVLDKVYPDPCHTEDGPTAIGPDVDDLVAAFSAMPGFEVTDVRDATVGGANGTSFQIRNSIDVVQAGCSEDMLPLGTYERDGSDLELSMFGGESDRFWVLDAGGTRLLMAVTDVAIAATLPVRDSISFAGAPTD